MIREEYKDLINYVSERTGKSTNMTWKVMKEFSLVVKDAIKRGDTIKIESLVTIYFTTKKGYIYKNKVYDLKEQIQDIEDSLKVGKIDIGNIVTTYLKRIRERVLDGYQVNLKGVCYLIPQEDDEGVICIPRVSPVLEKPEIADYVLITEYGSDLIELKNTDLRFKIDINNDLLFPFKIVKDKEEEKLNLKEVNI